MADERDPTALTDAAILAPASTNASSSPGAWLKQERERQGITTQRVAADMHLSVAAIDAIETDRFAVLGAAVFAKGHLRKYANLLGLSATRVLELYEQLEGAPRQVDPIPLTQREREPALRPSIRDMMGASSQGGQRTASMGPWIFAAVVFVIVVGGGAWWYLSHRGNPAVTQQVPQESSESMPVADSRTAEIAREAAPAPGSGQKTPPAEAAASPPARPARSAGMPPPGKVRVRLTFAKESWVEVYDVGGNRMLYDVGRIDLPRLIDVEPPALVVLGDATAVTTEANDKLLNIPPKNISGTVARFTIAADGSVH